MTEPVCDNEGNTYEKQAIMRWLARNRTSPISRLPLRTADLRPNIALKNLISSFNEKNKESTENLTMREARLKRFDGSRSLPDKSPLPPPPSMPPSSIQSSVREPDPIIHETLIRNLFELIQTSNGSICGIRICGGPSTRTGFCKPCWKVLTSMPSSMTQQEKYALLVDSHW
jgi:hypothetical protein